MDPGLKSVLERVSFPAISNITPEIIEMMRSAVVTPASYLDELRAGGITHREVHIPSSDGSSYEIALSILQPAAEATKPRPCLYWIHGGGYHWGDKLHTLAFPRDVTLECDAVVISVEYRLSPEHTFSTAAEDCYDGLKWTSTHVQELGVDPKRLMVGGMSAGGGSAAVLALLCRDRKGPVLCAQLLVCPTLDDRMTTVSSHQYLEGSDFLPRGAFEDMWSSTLREGKILPAGRIEDLSGLPTAYLDVGSAEVLRDEVVAYALKIWASGGQAELHVWAGGFHGFDVFSPDVPIAQASRKTKLNWVKSIFCRDRP